MKNDFLKFAVSNGMNSMHVENVLNASASYISPSILEERQLNVTQMDVFSRLMMDRIIFLGTEVNDYTANVIQAQLLYLDSVDSDRDISIYLNTPGGSVYAGLGIYDTMQFIRSRVATICTGMAASMAAVSGKTIVALESVTENQSFDARYAVMGAAKTENAMDTGIRSGSVSVSASVTAVYSAQ